MWTLTSARSVLEGKRKLPYYKEQVAAILPKKHRRCIVFGGWRLALVASWGGLLAAVFALAPADPGDFLVRGTVRVALLYYTAAVSLLALGGSWRLARLCWTLAWAAYLVHLAMAFHYYHHWSHADAVAHTRAVSGVGEGIYVSHLFTLLWTADVTWWWLRPAAYAARPAWIGRTLHGFMLFVVFNATVVYERGFIRWAGVGLTAWLAALAVWHVACRRGGAVATTEGRPAESS